MDDYVLQRQLRLDSLCRSGVIEMAKLIVLLDALQRFLHGVRAKFYLE